MFAFCFRDACKFCQFKFTRVPKTCVKRLCSKVANKFNETSKAKTVLSLCSYGQPTPDTHPHLLKSGELVPGIKLDEFSERRKKLMTSIFSQTLSIYDEPKHHIVIIPAATKTYMTENIPYIFRQNTDFLYLSGCLEPDNVLILTGSCEDDYLSTLFLLEQSAHSALWHGPRTGPDVAVEMFAVDQALYQKDLHQFLLKNIEDYPESLVYFNSQNSLSLPMNKILKSFLHIDNFKLHKSPTFFLHKLRAIKSPAEQNLMRKAGEISSEAIKKAMKFTKPQITEHQLFSVVDHESRMLGAEILAYPPVIAAGDNALIIHYIDNNQMIKEGDLILMDAGCQYHGYCGDISRTWPVSGKFTSYQKILYEIVLEVQKQIILFSEERKSLDFLHYKMIQLLGKYLSDEKIIKKDIQNINEINQIANDLCPHRVSHYLGMDVHDVALHPKNISLQPGIIITVEPGIYVNENNPYVPPEFWKTGIRIEDDILITETGCEVLSAKCPKEVHDIEILMKDN